MNEPRLLKVYYEGEQIGSLSENNGIWQFAYAPTWQGFALAPYLPVQDEPLIDQSTTRPVQWFFDNLLPEEGARQLMAREVAAAQEDVFSLLEAYGRESAGALVLTTDPPQPSSQAKELTDEDLSARIRALPRISLAADAPKKMSLAGAQHKLAVVLADGKLYEPEANTPSTHILKPDHCDPDNYWNSALNEYFVMLLAKRVGLSVPDVELRKVPESVYLIERFDRLGEWPECARRHTLDGCQLLGIDPKAKYRQSTMERLKQLVDMCRTPAQTQLRMFDWVVFNWLVGNTDAHLKNLSFLVDDNGIQLSPFYDLISTAIYCGEGRMPLDEELSQLMGEARTLGQVRIKQLEWVAQQLGMAPRLAKLRAPKLASKVVAQADELYCELIESGKVGPEVRMLREIIYRVIKETAKQIL